MIAACTWDTPGADRYLGTVPAAIAAYHFPIATQSALIEAWEKRDFTDTVVIDRDSIQGKTAQYAPEIQDMNFGGAGKRCSTVTRSKWSDDHVETAIVLCADGECVMVPSICLNVSRIQRYDAVAQDIQHGGIIADVPIPDALPLAEAGPVFVLPLDATGAGVAVTEAAPLLVSSGFGDSGGSFGGFGGGVVGGGSFVSGGVGAFAPCPPCPCIAPVAPVPEPSTWLLMLAGVASVFFIRRKT